MTELGWFCVRGFVVVVEGQNYVKIPFFFNCF